MRPFRGVLVVPGIVLTRLSDRKDMGRERLYVNDRGDCVMHVTGFSWLAAFALPLWALHRRLYILAVLMFVVINLVNLSARVDLQLALFLVQFLICGSQANRAHRLLLERRGWRVTAEEPAPFKGGP